LLKIVAISDIHGGHERFKSMPEGDVLIVAGDFGNWSNSSTLSVKFNEWLGKQTQYEHKLIICGNHETRFNANDVEEIQKIMSNGTYLQDSSYEIDGVKIWGTPWHRKRGCFYNASAFGVNEQFLEKQFNLMPSDVNILVTHPPPFGVLDLERAGNIGPLTLLNAVQNIKPNVHIFGHCHNTRGTAKIKDLSTMFVNVANTQKKDFAQPVIIEYSYSNTVKTN